MANQFGSPSNPSGNYGNSNYGLKRNNISSFFTPQETVVENGRHIPVTNSLSSNTNTYNSFGGNFTQKDGKQWTDSFGNPIQDLAQYTQSKERQQSGSDFSGYQSGVNTALNEQSDYNNRYKQLLDDPSKIQQTAGYQFDLEQGNQAINRSAAAKGMLNSGNVLAELLKYGQGMASKEYGNQLSAITNGSTLAGNKVNALSGLMQNSQKFGVDSGYYNPQQYLNPLDIKRSESKSWNWSGKM